MGFWIFMVIVDLLIPFTMIGFGWYFRKQAPGAINWVFGYRTEMSMKNKDTWEFAHNYIGKLWYRIGLIMLPLTVIPMLFVLGRDKDTVGNLGAAITIAVQSSSATTVMLVGLVNSGLMTMSQTLYVIYGANIGTTFTSWILSMSGIQSDNVGILMLKPENFAPVLALFGIFVLKEKVQEKAAGSAGKE